MVNASDLENNPNYPRHDNSERENWTFFYLRLNSADWTELDNKIEIITSQKTKLGQNNKNRTIERYLQLLVGLGCKLWGRNS